MSASGQKRTFAGWWCLCSPSAVSAILHTSKVTVRVCSSEHRRPLGWDYERGDAKTRATDGLWLLQMAPDLIDEGRSAVGRVHQMDFGLRTRESHVEQASRFLNAAGARFGVGKVATVHAEHEHQAEFAALGTV